MKDLAQKRIAITGAASGLGLAMARHYASQGWNVALADIQEEAGQAALSSLSGPGEHFFQKVDVSRIRDIQSWRRAIEKRWKGLDLLINNAGVASHGRVDEAPLNDWDWVIDINLMGVVRGCKEFIPLMKQQAGGGHIINIASAAGLLHSPEMASYNATKAGVVAVSETLQGELAGQGVGVSVVCPGFFQTSLAETARTSHPKVKESIEKLLASSKISADDIARIIYDEAEKGKFYILPHFNYRALWWMKRYLPSVYLRSMQNIGRKMSAKRKHWQNKAATEAG